MSAREFTLTIEMLSDWRVGSGTGRQGSIDDLTQRDSDGLPFIPASTIRGVWRDAAEQLAFALDSGSQGAWSEIVDHLFGSQPGQKQDRRGGEGAASKAKPLRSMLQVEPARHRESLRQYIREAQRTDLARAMTFVKTGVSINANTGTAKPDHLYFLETVRRGLGKDSSLFAKVTFPKDTHDALLAFAKASALLVKSIGGDRRRGLGVCNITIDEKANLDILKTAHAPTILEKLKAEVAYASPASFGEQATKFTTFTVQVALKEPCVIGDEVQGNTITTLGYIPGSLLLGPIASALENAGVARKNIDSAIVSGNIRVRPAYPALETIRLLPVPFCWSEAKDYEGKKSGLINFAVESADMPDENVWKQMRGGYVAAETMTRPQPHSAKTKLYTHNTVNDATQAPNAEVGGVYTYEALAAGQRFATVLEIDEKLLNGKLLNPTSGKVGRAVAAGYGAIAITFSETISQASNGGDLLYFESDCIVDESGSIKELLANLLTPWKAKINNEKVFVRTGRRDAWMGKVGLPHRTRLTIKAGSVVGLKGPLNAEQASTLEAVGLGPLRAEGFGIIRVSPSVATLALLDVVPAEKTKSPNQKDDSTPLTKDGAIVAWLENIAIRQKIRDASEQKAADAQWRDNTFGFKSSGATNAQFGTLRTFLGRLTTDDQRKAALAYARARPEEGNGKKASFASSLIGLLENPKMIFETGKKPDEPKNLAAINFPKSIEITDDLARFALSTAFHAALRQHKRQSDTTKGAE